MVVPTHHVYIIDMGPDGEKVRIIKFPTDQEAQALIDCEDYLVIDPLSNTFLNAQGDWEIIRPGVLKQENNIVMIR